LQNAINTYAGEMGVSFVTGQVPLSDFNTFVNRMNQMGLPELLALQQASYDRFMAR
jgi:putative aldouronate transport system substrate-binding protein